MLARLDAGDVEVVTGDALAACARLQAAGRRFDLVLLDPPFGQGWIARVMPGLRPLLRSGARVYVESESELSDEQTAGWGFTLLRMGRAGQVHYHLLQCD